MTHGSYSNQTDMLFVTCLFPLTFISAANLSKFSLESAPPPKNYNFTVKFLRKYERLKYDLILHVNNITKHNANRFLSLHPMQVTIFNHETTTEAIARPEYLKCVNVVAFHKPLEFSRYSSTKNNILASDIVVLVTYPSTIDELRNNYQTIPNLSKAGRILVFNYGDIVVDAYVLCFYCGPSTGFRHLRAMKYSQLLVENKYLVVSSFDNFIGHVLKVAYIDYFPYVFCTHKTTIDNSTSCTKAQGADFELLTTLTRRLNFNVELIEVPGRSYDDLFDGLKGEKYDLAIGGLSMTNPRRQVLQFSDVLKFEKIIFGYVYQTSFLKKVVGVFSVSGSVVGIVIACIGTLSIAMYLIGSCINRDKYVPLTRICTVRS